MRRVVAVTIILAAVALPTRAQSSREIPPLPLRATISGRVVADETGDPLPNARVSLTPVAQGTPVVLADADGRFTLTVPAGRYTVVAGKSGYARSEVTPTAGLALEIRLRRGAAISGRVVDEFGDPVLLARVAVAPRSSAPTAVTIGQTTTTDDRGEYRLAGIPAGSFVVDVVTTGAMTTQVIGNNQFLVRPATQKTYYPGVAALNEAEELRLGSGENRPGIDFVVSADQSVGQPFSVMMEQGPLTRPPAQNSAARATGIVRGRVVSTDGRTLPHAQVRLFLQSDLRQSLFSRADSDGRFEFGELPAGRFRVVASKSGYDPVASGGPAMPGPPVLSSGQSIDLADGETRERVDVSLARWGSLTGHVLDELGDPLQGASVQVLQVRFEAGRRRLVPAGGAARLTDDVGRYRLYGLAPGQYVISAAVGAVSSADMPGYTRSYFPGTPNPAEAQFVSIGPSQDTTGIDFSLARTRTARVAGKALNAAGEPTTAGTFSLTPSQRSSAMTSVPVGARISDDGTFEFLNVAPGQYIIQAYRGRPNSWTEGEFGTLPVSVNGTDVTDLVLQMSIGSSIRGRFTFDTYDRAKIPKPSGIELSPLPVDFDLSPQNNLASANIQPDWSFEILGVSGPRRLQLLRAPAGWALKEILVNGIDLTDRPLAFGRRDQSLSEIDVVLTDRVNEVNGAIADDRGAPAPGASLIVFSTSRDRWYPASRFLRTTVAGADGAFTIAGLPQGSYYAAAVAHLPADGEDSWQDPQLLELLASRASTLTLGDGQKLSLSLRLAAR